MSDTIFLLDIQTYISYLLQRDYNLEKANETTLAAQRSN